VVRSLILNTTAKGDFFVVFSATYKETSSTYVDS
jgi:hypothetical protein